MPGNSNLAIAQAAATPNTRLSGTAMAATSSVSRIAASASGSPKRRKKRRRPCRSASTKTMTQRQRTGTARGTATRDGDRAHRAPAAVWRPCAARLSRQIAAAARRRHQHGRTSCRLQAWIEIDDEQHGEGDDQHDRRDGRRAGIVEFLELDDDQQRRDLRHVGDVAGDEDHRAVFADGAREGEREAGEDRRQQRRQHHAADGLPAGRAERGGRLLDLALDLLASPAARCARRRAGR